MTISADGWVSWAAREPGPPGKVWAGTNENLGICLHSMEGWWTGSRKLLMDPDEEKSWHFSNLINGEFRQHYPIKACSWANGNRLANTRYWSVESEGTLSAPLNALQVANMVRLAGEFSALTGKPATRAAANRTLFEHKEVATISTPNAGATACPSARYAPFYAVIPDGVVPPPPVSGLTPNEVKILTEAASSAEQASEQLFGTGDPAEVRYVTVEGGADGPVVTMQMVWDAIRVLQAQGYGSVLLPEGEWLVTVRKAPKG